MSRYRNYNGNYRNRYFRNNYNYNYYNSDSRDLFPEIARLEYKYLYIISNNTGYRINPSVYNPNNKKGFFKINSYASFDCYKCGKIWTSNRVTIELWFNKRKRIFDVRLYGQQCKRCNKEFIKPFIYGIEEVIDICIQVLTSPYKRTKDNTNRYFNRELNSSHDQQRCQKCKMLGHPCW